MGGPLALDPIGCKIFDEQIDTRSGRELLTRQMGNLLQADHRPRYFQKSGSAKLRGKVRTVDGRMLVEHSVGVMDEVLGKAVRYPGGHREIWRTLR